VSNSGNVSLNVQVVGQDEVSAMLAQIAKQAKKTEADLNAVGNADIKPETSGISKATSAFGNTVEAVDKAEEKFNKFVGAIGFIGSAFAAVGPIYEFIKGIYNSQKQIEATKKSVDDLRDSLSKAIDKLTAINIARTPTESAKEALRIEAEKANLSKEIVGLVEKTNVVTLNLNSLLKDRAVIMSDIVGLESVGNKNFVIYAAQRDLSNQRLLRVDQAIYDASQEINKSRNAEKGLMEELLRLEKDRMDAIRANTVEVFKSLGVYEKLINKSSFLSVAFKSVDLLPEEEQKTKLPTGGPRAKTKSEIGEERTRQRIEDDAAVAKVMEALDKRLEAEERTRLALQNQLAISEDVMEFEAAILAEVEAFADLADTVDTATSSFDDFAQAVLGAADAFPELGDAMGGINQAMQKHAQQVAKDKDLIAKGELSAAEATVNAEQSRTQAIIEGSTAGLGAIAKLIGGKKAEYAIRAAGEVAMGFATLTNPVESAGHFVAAGLFAAAAGTSAPSGGGAGGGAGAAQETPTSSSMGYDQGGGGQRTVVYNFSTLIADRQQVGRAIRDSELVGQRNGYGRRRGV